MAIIFGVNTEEKIEGKDVRDAILLCFYQAHCNDSEIAQGSEELTRE